MPTHIILWYSTFTQIYTHWPNRNAVLASRQCLLHIISQLVVIYLFVRGVDVASFYDFDIWFWNCSYIQYGIFLCLWIISGYFLLIEDYSWRTDCLHTGFVTVWLKSLLPSDVLWLKSWILQLIATECVHWQITQDHVHSCVCY